MSTWNKKQRIGFFNELKSYRIVLNEWFEMKNWIGVLTTIEFKSGDN